LRAHNFVIPSRVKTVEVEVTHTQKKEMIKVFDLVSVVNKLDHFKSGQIESFCYSNTILCIGTSDGQVKFFVYFLISRVMAWVVFHVF